jgi:flagellar protein FlaJ
MDLKRTFLHLTLVQGFFGGLVAGKMGEGSISAGLKHSLVMMLLGYVALKFFL